MSKKYLAPSILAADFSNLQQAVDWLNESPSDWFHLDVMDGVFVPNISFGMPVIESLKKHAKKPLDVHLMITQPERYIQAFKVCGADILTVHYEASPHLHRTVYAIKEAGMKAGVALNPHTPVAMVEQLIELLDVLLIMSVNPGFGGQKFIENTYKKVAQARQLIDANASHALIEVDGGVNQFNAKQLYVAGADVLVAGNAIFQAEDPLEMIKKIKN